jgi:23S rRNA G2445 N2-methylase RlmL
VHEAADREQLVAGQAVYEPFCGSGTTIIAADMTGRVCHAIELNPTYVDASVRRWEDFTGNKAVLETTGQLYADVRAHRLTGRNQTPEAGNGQ